MKTAIVLGITAKDLAKKYINIHNNTRYLCMADGQVSSGVDKVDHIYYHISVLNDFQYYSNLVKNIEANEIKIIGPECNVENIKTLKYLIRENLDLPKIKIPFIAETNTEQNNRAQIQKKIKKIYDKKYKKDEKDEKDNKDRKDNKDKNDKNLKVAFGCKCKLLAFVVLLLMILALKLNNHFKNNELEEFNQKHNEAITFWTSRYNTCAKKYDEDINYNYNKNKNLIEQIRTLEENYKKLEHGCTTIILDDATTINNLEKDLKKITNDYMILLNHYNEIYEAMYKYHGSVTIANSYVSNDDSDDSFGF